MNREYFCTCCSLFFWHEQYQKIGDRKEYVNARCPNPKCESQEDPEDHILFAVDSYGFAYFAESNRKVIDETKWSSPKYAPPQVIEIYRRQGFRVVDHDHDTTVFTPGPIRDWIQQQTDLSQAERDDLAEELEEYFVKRRQRIEAERKI